MITILPFLDIVCKVRAQVPPKPKVHLESQV